MNPGKRIEIGPTKYPINVWLADTTSSAEDIRAAVASTSGRQHRDLHVHFDDAPPEDSEVPIAVAHLTHQQFVNELIFAHVWSDQHPIEALIDSGASMNYMDVNNFAKSLNFEVKPHRIRVMVADGRIVKSQGKVTIPITFDDDAQGALGEGHGYSCRIEFVLLPMPHAQAILGLPFLTEHNPMVDWRNNCMKFPEFDEGAEVHIQTKPRPAVITFA